MSIIEMSDYGTYPGRNPNTKCVSMRNLDLYFSYETVVAFRTPKTGLVTCENVWSNTTGRHLNMIDGGDKKARLKRQAFLEALEAATKSEIPNA